MSNKEEYLIDRFFRYVKIDTQSDENTNTSPSTPGQHDLAKLLYNELVEMGASDVYYDKEHCYIYATIPSNLDADSADGKKSPVIGFISHMDTSDAVSGKDVKPRIVEKYDGNDIILNEAEKVVLSPKDFPELGNHVGEDIIVTDGTTLLGADDKAGVSEIMTLAQYLLNHPEVKHGEIKIGFTPDEEIGEGTKHFDIERFGADFAYTVDGGKLGELEYENFNAAEAELIINGRSVHPGDAKNKMVNATLIAYEFQSMLPVFQNPMYTEGREGFFHLTLMKGTCEKAVVYYIIRDHDMDKFNEKKELFKKTVAYLNEKYGENTIELTMEDSYYNMIEKIRPHMHLIDNATKAMENVGVSPIKNPIRGGTDGAMLSFKGLPCPNLCTGGYNYHGKYEYASVQEMLKVVEILKELVKIYGDFKV
jgi:tripeptide aminopeptidase